MKEKTLLELIQDLKQLRENRSIRTGITLTDESLDSLISEIEMKAVGSETNNLRYTIEQRMRIAVDYLNLKFEKCDNIIEGGKK